MPFALVTIGLLMIITGINNTYSQFGAQLQTDFTGQKSFLVWIAAIGVVGALGYIRELRTFSHYFLALILIALVLAQKQGLWTNLNNAIQAGPKAPTASPDTSAPSTAGTAISPNASTSTINSAITTNQQGVGGSSPVSSGQAKFNGWMNYIFGNSTNSSGATQ